jgi:RNA polymerase sigma-70 factor (ECF subfamily)
LSTPGANAYGRDQPSTSFSLLERIGREDKEAWERFVSLYTPLVYYWCEIARLQMTDVEEVAQDVFAAVFRFVKDFHHEQEGGTFRGWLRRITINKIHDHRPPPGGRGHGGTDAQMQLGELAAPEPLELADASLEAAEKNILYNRAVELIELSFEPNSRRAFWLLIAGRTGKDVAAELGMSTGAVFAAKARILKRLREEFGELLP